jgi:hypothetical protein
MQILSNCNIKSLYHIENSVIEALKSDIFTFYAYEINKGDIWLQFEKLKKLRQMALSFKNNKNKYQKEDISTIDAPPGTPGVAKEVP